MQIEITLAKVQDIPEVLRLIHELAEYENEPEQVENTIEQLTRDCFGSNKVIDTLVAKIEDAIVGTAIFYTGYSTWKGRTLYLEDLIVSENYRRLGIGKLLFKELQSIAQQRGAKRMDWQVLDWNEPAIKFYKSQQAEIHENWLNGHLFF